MAEKSEWWKNYYVRYFVGSAFAIPLVLILSKKLLWIGSLGTLSERPWISATVVGLGGLAFCYAASAPILVFHASRSMIWRRTSVSTCAVVAISIASACALITAVLLRFFDSPGLDWILTAPFVIVVLLQVACLFLLATRLDGVQEFYSLVAKFRADSSGTTSIHSEYIESYRHLREHGNAFSILSLEIALTLALLALGQTPGAFALVLISWILPSSIAWIIGTWLEGSIDRVL